MPQTRILSASLMTFLVSMSYISSPAAASVDNVVGIASLGSPTVDGGLDSDGYAYSAALLGQSITWGDSTFALGAAGTFDAASSTTIPLPATNDSRLNLLATAVNGSQRNQTFVVTYTDGTTSTFTQSLSDWYSPQNFAGESQALKMAYRISPRGAEAIGPIYLYGYSFAINGSKTLKSITLPKNRDVILLAAAAASPASTAPQSGSQADNVIGIVANGSHVPAGGLDNEGYAYSATLLGGSIAWNGSTFTLGAPGTMDAVSGVTLSLPPGNYGAVNLLATAVNGNQPNQTFVVTYSDGSTASFTQSLSDWFAPQRYGGETKVSEMPYRINSSGAESTGPFYLYAYSFAVDAAKTIKSIALPRNRNVVVLGTQVSKASTVPFVAAAPSLTPAPGTYAAAQAVKLSDSTSGALIYYTMNGSTPTTSSALYTAGTPLEVSSTTTIKAIAVESGYSSSPVTGGTYTIASAASPPPVARTLAISGTAASAAQVGTYYSFTPTVVAPAGSKLTYEITHLPSWAQFSAATGALSGTPTAGSASTDAGIVISVSDGSQSASLSAFSIAVSAPASAPAETISVSWTQPARNTNGTPLTDLAGYVVEYGKSSTALNSTVSINSPSSTNVQIDNLSAGKWYFAVAAVTTAHVVGQFSAVASETVN
jgi:hypothetical protein